MSFAEQVWMSTTAESTGRRVSGFSCRLVSMKTCAWLVGIRFDCSQSLNQTQSQIKLGVCYCMVCVALAAVVSVLHQRGKKTDDSSEKKENQLIKRIRKSEFTQKDNPAELSAPTPGPFVWMEDWSKTNKRNGNSEAVKPQLSLEDFTILRV